MKNILFLGLILLLASCSKSSSENEHIYWVNSYKVDCMGVAPMSCLQIQKSESIVANNWQNFYSNIEGFEFEPGYIYKLKVLEEKLDKVPADASSIKYTLTKVLEKKQDERLKINDIWVAEEINGETIKLEGKAPQIEIHVAKMQVMGTDACNNFNGEIRNLEEDAIEFGPIASTRMMCADMTIPDKFNVALSQVKKYKIENLQLTFLNEQGKELIVFKKID